ncbi:unnamed protein product [Dicrocoelium dendriticum]|nr:unnamed protein product [Dicrocoelium dendriticum]
MARWGEGDPRWIVEERADAKNVNNWHWTEKNATQWSIDVIKELFQNFSVENESFVCNSLCITKCEGESHVNNRKGKLIFFYEWHIEGDWTGQLKTGENKTTFSGKVEIPNLSEEYTVDELDISVSCSSSTSDGDAIRKFMQTVGAGEIKSRLGLYLRKLKEEYSQNLILPTKSPLEVTNCNPASPNPPALKRTEPTYCRQPKDLSVKELTFTDEFFCTPEDLYKVLTTKELVQAFSRDEAVVDATIDGKYSIFGGNVTGVFTKLVPGKNIGMQWRKREWPDGHFSDLSLEMSAFDGGTRLVLNQTGVPAYDVENTTNGWRSNFFATVKQTFGYGGRMF